MKKNVKNKPSKKSKSSKKVKPSKCNEKGNEKLIQAISEDLRKIGIFLIGIGQLGIFVVGDKITGYEGLLAILVGILFWVIGLFYSRVSSELLSIDKD